MSDRDDFIIQYGILKKYTGQSKDVVIPDGVKSIGDNAFADCGYITSVTIPDGVKQIKKNAFMNCTGLESVQFSGSLTEIRDSAFEGCKRLNKVYIPAGVQSIGAMAFKKCLNMTAITLPDTLEFVGVEAFWDCHKLRELIFPPQTVFQGKPIGACWNLINVILPETEVEFVPVESNRIKCIVAPNAKIEHVYETSNRFRNKQFAAAVGYIKYTDRFTDKEIIDSYNTYLFRHKKDLLPVIWENDAVSVLSILAENGKISKTAIDKEYIEPAMRARAMGCVGFLMDWKHQNVKVRSISKDLAKIDKDPYSVSEMKKLWGYTNLDDGTIMITHYKGEDSEITIPPRIGDSKVSQIGPYAISPYMASAQGIYKKRSPKRFAALGTIKSVTISEGISSVNDNAFYRCNSLASIMIPSTVLNIGKEAFYGCISLNDVTLSDGMENIGNSAFESCKRLNNIVIPDSVTNIGSYAFAFCSSLKHVTLPESITSIRSQAFLDTPWLMSQPKGFITAGRVVIGYTGSDHKVIIPDGIISIGDDAFEKNGSLTSVTIPYGVKSIGMNAFFKCCNLEEVIIPDSVEKMDSGVFLYSENTVIKTNKGSYAEQYANENGIPVELIDE